MGQVWPDDAPEPVRRERFDPDADLSPTIRAALDSDDPGAELAEKWPWVPAEYRDGFVAQATAWAITDTDLDVLIARYSHAVAAYWVDAQNRRPWWRRLLRKDA